jgi:phospholipase C
MRTGSPQSPIQHVIVLMLENRSYDHMLGFMTHPSIPPLTEGAYPNRVRPGDPTSATAGVSPTASHAFAVDPPHSHLSVMKSLGRSHRRDRSPSYPMDGFVEACFEKAACKEVLPIIHWWRIEGLVAAVSGAIAAYGTAKRHKHLVAIGAATLVLGSAVVAFLSRRPQYRCVGEPAAEGPALQVMKCQPEDHVPVLTTLAKEYAVATRWFASVPGETWPNRNFAHAATSEGATGNEPGFFSAKTIFHSLEEARRDWHVYYDGMPQVMVFDDLWKGDRIVNWFRMAYFWDHVADDTLPAYSFIEPRHQGGRTNSQHPGNNREPGSDGLFDFERGERLIRDIYAHLLKYPKVFEKTLLLITYDEHGGLFDHVSPETTVAPSLREASISLTRRIVRWFVTFRGARFDFKRYGVRVPAVIVSPWIPRGTVASNVFDHSSIVATLRKLFAPGARPLTRRDERAATFDVVLTATAPREGPPLPDLAPPTRVVRPAEEQPVPFAAEESEFSKQLDQLAEEVDRELTRRGVAPAGDVVSDLTRELRQDRVPHASTLARFEAEAERRRTG